MTPFEREFSALCNESENALVLMGWFSWDNPRGEHTDRLLFDAFDRAYIRGCGALYKRVGCYRADLLRWL